MLCVLKRTVSMRQFFEHPKHMFELTSKKIVSLLHLKNSTLDLWICGIKLLYLVFNSLIAYTCTDMFC